MVTVNFELSRAQSISPKYGCPKYGCPNDDCIDRFMDQSSTDRRHFVPIYTAKNPRLSAGLRTTLPVISPSAIYPSTIYSAKHIGRYPNAEPQLPTSACYRPKYGHGRFLEYLWDQ